MQLNLFPSFHFFRRERFKEFGTDLDLTFPRSGLALSPFILDGHEPDYRLLPPSDDNLLASARFLDQPGELGFSLVDGNCFHDQS